MSARFRFTAVLWEYDSPGGWHFLSLPDEHADEIEATVGHRSSGFGSLQVAVTIGSTKWRTSIFPDRKSGTYLLPVKKSVRVAEQLTAGSMAQVDLVVVQ